MLHPQQSAIIAVGGHVWHRLFCLLAALAVGVLIVWTALGKWELPRVGPAQGDYYNLLLHGFQKGTLALDLPVSEAVRQLENPWDPAKRPADLWVPPDSSYAHGHYYLYFGVAPVFVLFWPFHLLTGSDLPFGYALCAFCLAAFLLLGWLWLRVLRDHFPQAGLTAKLGGLLVLGLAGGLQILARRANFWELPIAAGQCFMALMLICAYQASQKTRPEGWLAGAGLALGLAVGSRPSLVVAAGGLAVLIVMLAWRADGWRQRGRQLLLGGFAAGAPLAVCIGLLFAYNYARFGKPLEFGLNYQLTSVYEAKATHFSASFVPYNFYAYFLSQPLWGRYFPFIDQGTLPKAPPGYYTAENVYGLLYTCPVLGFLLLWPCAWRRLAAGAGRGGGLGPWGGAVLAVALATTGIMLCFNTAVSRYVADFTPWWLLLALLGYVAGEADFSRWRWCRAGLGALFAICVGATVLIAFFASSRLHGMLKSRNPEAYGDIAYAFNVPVFWLLERPDEPRGAVTMDVVFPEKPERAREPLLVTGRALKESDEFFVEYLPDNRVRFGYENSMLVHFASEPVQIEDGRHYQMRLESGSLYPPLEHPLLRRYRPLEAAWIKDWVRLELDGRVLIDAYGQTCDALPETVSYGVDRRANREDRFSGYVQNVRRGGLMPPLEQTRAGGDVWLQLSLPPPDHSLGPTLKIPAINVGRPQPLVTAGVTGHADLLAIRLPDANSYTLCYESWTAGMWESPPLPVPPERTGLFRLRLGSILAFDDASPLALLRNTVAVWLDNQPVWWHRTGPALDRDPVVDILHNNIASNAALKNFHGRVGGWGRLPAPAPWRKGPVAFVRLFLAGRGTGSEPLVATGPAGAANTLAIEWLPQGRARLHYDHWSYGIHDGPAFAWGENEAHRLEIDLPALRRLDAGTGLSPQPAPLRVKLDGVVIWDEEVPFYFARSETVAIGQNRAGSSIAEPALTDIVLEIEQGPSVRPAMAAQK